MFSLLKVKVHKKSVSLICSVNTNKILHYEIYENSVNRNTFMNFIKNVNRKTNRKLLLMDNARIHHANIIKNYMKYKSNKIIYNVPYNPQTNPIELVFGKIKSFVKKQFITTLSQLKKEIKNGINMINKTDLTNYFKHSFK